MGLIQEQAFFERLTPDQQRYKIFRQLQLATMAIAASSGSSINTNIDGLDGEGENDLDAIATEDLAVDSTTKTFIFEDQLVSYQLTAGTAAQNLPWVVLPYDYAPTTNEKYWSKTL